MASLKMLQEIANSKDRIIAHLIDWSIIIGMNLLILPILTTYIEWSNFFALVNTIIFFFVVSIVFYSLLFEIFLKGQTPGKKSRHIRIAKLDGSLAHTGHYLLRWVARPFNFISLGLIAFVKIRGRKGWQLTDLLSNTMVIKQENEIDEPITESTIKDKPKAPNSLINNIAEASKNARKIYLLFIGVLAYSALTVVSTSDRSIILNEPARLPVINLDVSLDGFFILAPVLSIFIFSYFQLYLHKLKRLINDLRKNYQPIKEDQEIYPWMINFVNELGSGFIARTQRFIVKFSLWWSLPAVLVFLAMWYIKKHNPVLSGIVGIMPLIGTLMVIGFYIHYQQSANNSFKFNYYQIKGFLKKNKDMRIMLVAILILEIYIFSVFIPRALQGERLFGSWPAVDLSHQNLINRQDEEFKTVYWANLRNAQLQGADLRGAILKKADLRDANLKNAKLIETQLQGADFQDAEFINANLEGAKLDSADLRGAILNFSNLNNAKLAGAKFDTVCSIQGVNFFNNHIDFEQLKDVVNFEDIQLRTLVDTIAYDSVITMLNQKKLFDRRWNPTGNGLGNMFELQQDGKVVMDYATNLMWQQGGSSKYMHYERAKEYITELNQKKYAGFSDWRLPTLEEAMSLMEPEQKNNLYIHPVFDTTQRWIWTSDLVKGESEAAWVVGFNFGNCNSHYFFYGVIYVRAVRSGQSS